MADLFERQLADVVREPEAGSRHTSHTPVPGQITPEFFDHCDHVGISLIERDRIRTPPATNERSRELDDAKYELGEWPPRGDPPARDVFVDDVATDTRWTRWGRAMVDELGIRSRHSFRLFSRPDDTWRALNGYSNSPLFEGVAWPNNTKVATGRKDDLGTVAVKSLMRSRPETKSEEGLKTGRSRESDA